MADFADLAAEREQQETARAIEAARSRTSHEPVACGLCHNCEEVIEGAAFCDADCRDDWELRRRAAR
ncbi:hypothetical protein [Aromatoleum aromaticum]|uniref:hypothetical protein n=1 Tax=Aromatoleum aromaticum TaxID=551760 RepID=UPI00030D00ED|nr:hypothetical protein [Aromatoleum aromaticum]